MELGSTLRITVGCDSNYESNFHMLGVKRLRMPLVDFDGSWCYPTKEMMKHKKMAYRLSS